MKNDVYQIVTDRIVSLLESGTVPWHKPTPFSSFLRSLSRGLSTEPVAPPRIAEVEAEPEPQPLVRDSLVELQTTLPANLNIPKEALEQFLSNLSLCHEPVAFELLGVANRVTAQFVTGTADAPHVRRQLQAYFAEAVFQSRDSMLESIWITDSGEDELAVEFGLEREFMFSLASGKLDPFVGIVGALSELHPGEVALFQVLFQPVAPDWSKSVIRAVSHADGKPFFVNAPELTEAARNKVARPLFAAVVRIALRTAEQPRTLQLARDLAASLRVFANPHGNALIPLSNDEYPFAAHIEDLLRRQSRRTGMLLNSDELIGFVHLPSSAVRSPALPREINKTNAAPITVRHAQGLFLGNNLHAGHGIPVRLTPEQRTRHVHIIGASGTGKSTLLYNLVSQDIAEGRGVAVLDPHGDLVDRLLASIPVERVNDVVLVDPSDEEYAVGFNILSAHSELEKQLLASDLVSVFQRLSTSWGDQMNSVLQNAILAFLESPQGGTLADLRRFLVEPAFRAEHLKTVQDSELLYYWQKGFPQLTGNKSIGPVITRLETFLAPKPIRHMVSQRINRLDFADIMDKGKIFLAKLSQGLLGKENSHLLGTLLVSKFQQTAMSRQAQRAEARRDFALVVDEFDNFISPSMAQILTGTRKYRLGMILAHHELRQLQRNPDVASAVLTHCHTRICFRVGDEDARKLSEGFAHFETRDLLNLGTGEAIARVERSDFDFNLTVPPPGEPGPTPAFAPHEEVVATSRKKYATPRSEVEAALRASLQAKPEPTAARSKPAPSAEILPAPETKPQAVSPPPPVAPAPPQLPKPTVPESSPPPTKSAPVESTGSEKELKPVQAAPEPLRDLGRGGAQHQAIQKRIKEAAEKLEFRGTIEKPILDGQGSVDLLLERGGQRIACEISISTTIDHEVGNAAKCLKAGIEQVVMICVEPTRLAKLKQAITGSLGPGTATRIKYFEPDDFIAHLQSLPPPAPPTPPADTRLGYKIKRSVPTLSPEERRQREDIAYRNIAEVMRRPKSA